jgi:hypothetical protein
MHYFTLQTLYDTIKEVHNNDTFFFYYSLCSAVLTVIVAVFYPHRIKSNRLFYILFIALFPFLSLAIIFLKAELNEDDYYEDDYYEDDYDDEPTF